MRLGKFIEHLKAAAVAVDAKNMDPILRYLAIGRQLGYAAYLSLDNLYYLHNTGIRKIEGGDNLSKTAYKAWWCGLACNVLAGVYTLYKVQGQQKKLASSDDAEKKVEEKKLEKYVLLRFDISNLCYWKEEIKNQVAYMSRTGNYSPHACSFFRTLATSSSHPAPSASSTWTTASSVWPVPPAP